MDTIKVNPHHLSEINTKEVVFSGSVNDYGTTQSGVDTIVCIAPHAMRLTSFIIRAETLETAGGTVDVKKIVNGGTFGNGVDMVTQVIPTSATLTTKTNYSMTLGIAANIVVTSGDMVALVIGSTGELTGLAYQAVFERV